jgi:hypothetical protein
VAVTAHLLKFAAMMLRLATMFVRMVTVVMMVIAQEITMHVWTSPVFNAMVLKIARLISSV